MKRACCDCEHLSSYGGNRTSGFVECARHTKQYVTDPFEHVRSYVCDNFAPKFISNGEPRALHGLLCAQHHGSPSLRATLERWFAGPPNDVTVFTARGLPMLSVADGDLETFEFDKKLKSYQGSNHLFADLFGGMKVKWPILFFLSDSNAPGVRVDTLGEPDISVLYLGAPYSLAEIVAALSHILNSQQIRLIRPWFLRHLRSVGIDATDPSFGNFMALSPELDRFLRDNRNSLVGSRTVIAAPRNEVDEQAVADALGFESSDYLVLRCDASRSFHMHHDSSDVRDFSGPVDLHDRLAQLNLLAVFASPRRYDDLWKLLPEGVFSDTPTTLIFVDDSDVSWARGLAAFRDFKEQGAPRSDLAFE
jgi:hypothetical protein